jgi:hypothetical protein
MMTNGSPFLKTERSVVLGLVVDRLTNWLMSATVRQTDGVKFAQEGRTAQAESRPRCDMVLHVKRQ